jgi:serine/threonine-protein kinase RsbW
LDAKEDLIRLRLPADPFSQQVIRLAVYMIGSRMDFNLAQLEDLRIAVDEASSYTLSHTNDEGIIQVEIGPGTEYLEIILASIPSKDCQGHLAIPASLSRLIMESVVDAVDIQNEEAVCRISLRKKSPFQEISPI